MMEKEERSHRDSADRSLHREEKVTLFQYDDDGGGFDVLYICTVSRYIRFPPFHPGLLPGEENGSSFVVYCSTA